MGNPIRTFFSFTLNKTGRSVHVLLIAVLLVGTISCAGSSNNESDDGNPPAISTSVQPLYPNSGANWNDYVKSDSPARSGDRRFSATDTACEASTDTRCLHGGLMRSAIVPQKSTCSNLTASDKLGVFEWICDNSTDPVRMVSMGIKNGKGLSDLIDFSNAAWKNNNVTVFENGSPYAASDLSTWWSNSIVVNNDGSDGSDMNTGEIHLVTGNPEATYSIGADQVALVIQPDITLTGGDATNDNVISSTSRAFFWIEGTIDATGDYMAVYLKQNKFSTVHRVTAKNANSNQGSTGIYLEESDNNILSQVTSIGNFYGVAIDRSSSNVLIQITANDNFNGVNISGSSNNLLNQITTMNSTGDKGGSGVYLIQGSNNVLNQITAKGFDCVDLVYMSNTIISQVNASCFNMAASPYNLFTQIVSNGAPNGFHFESYAFPMQQGFSYYNTLNHITASGSEVGINLDDGPNLFTGELRVGTNTTDCTGSSPGYGLNPDCSNNGGSDAALTTGINLSSSFVTDSWELLTTDDQLLNVLSLPITGNETFTHSWSDESMTTILRNAVEILGDGIGNENSLCESGESCLFTPNIGRYQGHGNLMDAGIIDNGDTLREITLKKYETNGY